MGEQPGGLLLAPAMPGVRWALRALVSDTYFWCCPRSLALPRQRAALCSAVSGCLLHQPREKSPIALAWLRNGETGRQLVVAVARRSELLPALRSRGRSGVCKALGRGKA